MSQVSRFGLQAFSAICLAFWLVLLLREVEPSTKKAILSLGWGAPYMCALFIRSELLVGTAAGTSLGGIATATVFLFAQFLGAGRQETARVLEMLLLSNLLLFSCSVAIWFRNRAFIKSDRTILSTIVASAYMGVIFVLYDLAK
jgi:hypothetical protein